jgi:hypothetical protein
LGAFLTQRLVARRTDGARPIAALPAWERTLAGRYGVQKAALLAAKVQARYAEMFDGRPRFSNSALRDHLETHILPGIALYHVLQEVAASPAQALEIVDACFTAQVEASPMTRPIRLLERLPGAFAILRIANRLILRNGFPEQGWQIGWIEDSPQCVAYDITGCFYLNVLSSYGVPELTARFCAGDDLLYGNLKNIAWERTETLGRGDARCNFVFRPRVQLNVEP